MESNLCTVKTKAYHHGDLRRVLIAAATDVLVESGVNGFSMREAARRAGVSPGAPKHHFSDSRALLTAIAAAAFADLGDRLEQAADSVGNGRRKRLIAQGVAYVAFALDQPARFDLIWRVSLLDARDPALVAAGDRAFAAVDRLVRGEHAEAVPRTDPAMAPTMACWGMVHGLASLALEGAVDPLNEHGRADALDMVRNAMALLVDNRVFNKAPNQPGA